jgi:hypothetical protein
MSLVPGSSNANPNRTIPTKDPFLDKDPPPSGTVCTESATGSRCKQQPGSSQTNPIEFSSGEMAAQDWEKANSFWRVLI